MSELKLVTRNIRINGIQHKASDMSEEEIKCLLIQRHIKVANHRIEDLERKGE